MENKLNISDDSFAILLICSDLALNNKETEVKAFTISQWSKLAENLFQNDLTPKAIFDVSTNNIKKKLNLPDETVERIERLLSRSGQFGVEMSSLNNKGIFTLTKLDKEYPSIYRTKLKKQAPPVLYYSGNLLLLNNKGVSIVGSRDIDQAGIEFTEKLSERCTNDGLNIISGGARGVDSIAEKKANESDGTTVIILADSMDRKIRNKDTRDAIIRNQSLILSPFRPDMPFQTYAAMERNKYVYALANFVVVVSSDYNKGGTWSGATENLRKSWVPMFVRKADNVPQGNIKLLMKENVYAITEDVFVEKKINIDKWFESQIVNASCNSKPQQLSFSDM